MDFLWHKVSEKEKEEIKHQAKKIVDDFSKRLAKVAKIPEPIVERDEGEREEGHPRVYTKEVREPLRGSEKSGKRFLLGAKCAEIDKKIMFGNAPEKNKDFIIAEKGGW